jgi:2Fe-2S ferredoxin
MGASRSTFIAFDEEDAMPLIHVLDRDGVEHDLEIEPGLKIMEGLREVDYGVAAICGGMCSCGSCHIYVDPESLQKLPPAMSDERELLSELSWVRSDSRLACQIDVTTGLEGLRITIAPEE